ncbi:hypothetical protein QJQ45_018525 [Haematococcus lacustris]|nr:hypothetical protein QJQ45_018525 [Haematococcus lacustris]
MAKALRCGQCKALLANVKEAQNHNEITGHTSFEETTEEIRVMKCKTCGKPARSPVEQSMHTRFTGHTEYEDATVNEGPLNTEQQMKEARSELESDEALVAAALHKKPAAAAAAAAAAGSPSPAAADGDTAMGGTGAEEGSSSGQAMVSPEVDQALVAELEGMGFNKHRAVRAVYHSQGGVEGAVNWIMEHENDADIDTPLLVTQASEASKLSPEESKKRALELIRAAKEKREKEERELAAHRERERIRAGKELLLAKKQEDGLALKRMVEQRKLEKEEEARAREKAKARLEEDRRERRRKLGLPEELTPEEKVVDPLAREAERAAAAVREAEEKKKKNMVFGHVKPVTGGCPTPSPPCSQYWSVSYHFGQQVPLCYQCQCQQHLQQRQQQQEQQQWRQQHHCMLDKLRSCLVDMKKQHSSQEEVWKTAGTTLLRYLTNIANQPDEEKFRSIRTTNAAFQQRVAAAHGSMQFLEHCGFTVEGEALVLARNKLNPDVIQGGIAALQDMLGNPFFGCL